MSPDQQKWLAANLAPLKAFLESTGQVDIAASIAPETTAPELNLKQPISSAARQLSDIVRGHGLYRWGEDELCTVDEGTGRIHLMKPVRFVSWIEQFCVAGCTKHGTWVADSMGRHRAEEIMASADFRAKLSVLTRVNPVPLPVRRRSQGGVGVPPAGAPIPDAPSDPSDPSVLSSPAAPVNPARRALGPLQLLEPGYDPESGIFTTRGGLDYPTDVPATEAIRWWKDFLQHFPWSDEQAQSNHMACMLTLFCASMMPRGARPPMFMYNANKPGSGKTRLAQMAQIAIYGESLPKTWEERPEDFKKAMDSFAQAGESVIFFDDLVGFKKSTVLNSWLTSSRWSGRILGSRDTFNVPLNNVTILTGNELTTPADLDRRAVKVDLFAHEASHIRKIPKDVVRITEEWLYEEDNRRTILANLWALVRDAEESRLFFEAGGAVPDLHAGEEPLASFEAWSRIVPWMVCQSGHWQNPLKPVQGVDFGNPEQNEAIELAKLVLDVIVQGREAANVTLDECIPLARLNNLFLAVLHEPAEVLKDLNRNPRHKWPQVEVDEGEGTVRVREMTDEEKLAFATKWSDRSMDTSFGHRFKKQILAQYVTDTAGRRYQFGNREGKKKSTLAIKRIEK